jgi:hypothetical protein
MREYVARYIRGCILYCTNKPSNRKQGLYHPLPIPARALESISMDFVGGLQTTKKGHEYIFTVVDRFNNMCIIMPCIKTIKGKETTNFLFEQVQMLFGIPRSIISNMDTRFLNAFWSTLLKNVDTNLNRSTTFNP